MPPVVLRRYFIYHSRYINSAIGSVVKQHSKNKTAQYQAASYYSLTVDNHQRVHTISRLFQLKAYYEHISYAVSHS